LHIIFLSYKEVLKKGCFFNVIEATFSHMFQEAGGIGFLLPKVLAAQQQNISRRVATPQQTFS
jgi:hypothetical protein